MSGVETRQISRDSLFLLAELRLEDRDQLYRVRVRNLSARGMMAEGSVRVVRGARLSVDLRNVGWVEGTVAWVQDDRFGIAFDEEIDPQRARAQPEPSPTNAPRYTRPPLSTAGTYPPDRFRKI